MRILVVGASGKTGRHVIAALQAHGSDISIRGFSRSGNGPGAVELIAGDLDSPADRKRAVSGIDAVIYYGPTMDPRETAMGTGIIDAAIAASVRRFIYISVIHPAIDDLMNHRAKQEVESYLLDTGLDWTILRPQHYMQNVDVKRALASGVLAMPYPVETILGHVDLADLGEAAAKVALEPGHSFASYDIAADVHLSVVDICQTISEIGGKHVEARAITAAALIDHIQEQHSLSTYSVEGLHRLFGYYGRRGIRGNSNVLTWLLGRSPTSFEAYIKRVM